MNVQKISANDVAKKVEEVLREEVVAVFKREQENIFAQFTTGQTFVIKIEECE